MTTKTPNINITEDMIDGARTVFKAMAFVQTIKPIVETYQHKIIAEIKPVINDQFKKIGFDKVITEAKDAYLMNDDDFKTYLKRCNEERIKAKLYVDNEEFCPLLVAEDLQRQAERAFIEVMFPITHITADMALCSANGLENYHKLIDLSLRLVAPYVKNNLEVEV